MTVAYEVGCKVRKLMLSISSPGKGIFALSSYNEL